MDEIRAAYGLLNLKQVDAAISDRQRIADTYKKALCNVEGISFMKDVAGSGTTILIFLYSLMRKNME